MGRSFGRRISFCIRGEPVAVERGHLPRGRSAGGIEASPTDISPDFTDLVVTLPANARVRSRVS